ncbi:MAG: hypothetical protein AAGI49_06230 [Bacteroidota bacterium]
MRYLLAFFVFAVLTSCSSTAGVFIEPNETFVLGEYQNTSFRAKLTNTSSEEIKISVVDTESQQQTQGFGLSGKSNAKIYVSKNETARIINPSDKHIKVKAVLSRNVEGMRYEKNKN